MWVPWVLCNTISEQVLVPDKEDKSSCQKLLSYLRPTLLTLLGKHMTTNTWHEPCEARLASARNVTPMSHSLPFSPLFRTCLFSGVPGKHIGAMLLYHGQKPLCCSLFVAGDIGFFKNLHWLHTKSKKMDLGFVQQECQKMSVNTILIVRCVHRPPSMFWQSQKRDLDVIGWGFQNTKGAVVSYQWWCKRL